MRPVTFLLVGAMVAILLIVLQACSEAPPSDAPAPTGAAAPGAIEATRLFAGRDSFPPEAFAAYGILAFDTLATGADRDRYVAICEAFFGALVNATDADAPPPEAQMVTVWPVDDRDDPGLPDALNTARAGADSCDRAVDFYDVQVAQTAIDDARRAGVSTSGRGPFLLAWAPAARKGAADAVVLAADMGGVTTAQEAKDVLRIWRDDIERDPSLWTGGFTVEKLRVKLRQIANRYGEALLRFMGG